jgi:hypothetical protein
MTRTVAMMQGVYYIVTGIWPLISMNTFEWVSGPKTDDWLVRTVGILVVVVGLVLVSAAIKRDLGAPARILGVGSAAGLAWIDFFYAMRGVIWPIYMLDGIGQVGLIVLWAIALMKDRRTAVHA